ncbi:hypothetical protein GCM10022267_31070 [Lentzea roselyniae]|uniref:Uncharacterized protein n=1 Tax=Lentzea roselyniae TaxID=531940 RepID=A0ABP7AWA1_9PSEU
MAETLRRLSFNHGRRQTLTALNDNGRCFARTVDGLAARLERLRGRCRRKLASLPAMYPIARKPMIDKLGFACIGPVYGHDLQEL